MTAPLSLSSTNCKKLIFGGGAFNNPRGSLNTKRLIAYRGDALVGTEEGGAFAVAPIDQIFRRKNFRPGCSTGSPIQSNVSCERSSRHIPVRSPTRI
jgi:hypothetical protein